MCMYIYIYIYIYIYSGRKETPLFERGTAPTPSGSKRIL